MNELVAITGADGFIGRQLCKTLASEGLAVRALQRQSDPSRIESIEYVPTGDIGPDTEWSETLHGVTAIVHLAGRAHRMDENPEEAASLYEKVNLEGTRRLAASAAGAGVRRLVFLSTAKVHGERTAAKPFAEGDPLDPTGPYAVSKWKAELALHEVSRNSGLEVAIIRPPLVYGPGVRANFLRLMRLVDRGIPLPIGGIKNKRSLVGLGNLIAMILVCLRHPAAAGESFLVSDGNDLSTPDLVKKIGASLDRACMLLPLPTFLLKIAGRMLGKGPAIGRLVESMQVETSKARTLLGWNPRFSVDQELARTAEWYRHVYRKT